MHWARWIVGRARARPAMPAAILIIVCVAALILGGVSGLAEEAATSAARDALRVSMSRAMTVQVRMGPDPAEQDRLARASLTDAFAPAPVDVHTTIISEPFTVDGARIVAWHAGDLDNATVFLATGRWPSSDEEAMLHADAAELAGLAPEDAIDMGGMRVTISGTWRPADPADARWLGDELALTGADAQLLGPLLVSEGYAGAVPGDAFIRWSVVPVTSTIGPRSLTGLADGAARAKDLVGGADATGRGVVVDGDLGEAAGNALRAWSDARALGLVPWAIVLTVTVVSLAQVGSVVSAGRSGEVRLLLARGAAPGEVVAVSLVESGAASVIGALSGGILAAVLLRAATGDWARSPAVLGGVAVALLAALATLVVAVVLRVRTVAAHSTARAPASPTGLLLAMSTTGILLTASAGLASWRLLLSGRITGGDSLPGAFVSGALAPAVLLWTTAWAAVLVLTLLFRALHDVGRRTSRGQLFWLASAHLARSRRAVSIPGALTVMAVGSVTLASLFLGSSRVTEENLATLSRGADLRAGLTAPPVDPAAVRSAPRLTDVAGVTGDSLVWRDGNARLGDVGIHVLAAPLDALAEVATLPAGSAVPTRALRPAPGSGPIAVTEGATSLTIGLGGELSLDAWQAAQLRLVPELSRRQMDAPWVSDPVDAAVDATAEEFDRLGGPTVVSTRVTLRDADTGISQAVEGPELTIPGLGIGWDPATDAVTWAPSRAAGAATVTLPADTRFVVDEVAVRVRGQEPGRVTLTLRLDAGGRALNRELAWTSDVAVPADAAGPYQDLLMTTPVRVGIAEQSGGDLTTYTVSSNRPAVPPLVAEIDGGWSVEGDPADLTTLRLGPRIAFSGADPAGVVAARPPVPRVPVALTAPAAAAAGLEEGDEFELFAFQRRVPAVLVVLAPAIPGTTEPLAALADARAVAQTMAADGHSLPWPTELWAATARPEEAAKAVAAHPGVDDVLAGAPEAPSAEASRRTFLSASVGVAALALAGIAATVLAQLDGRRGEVRVLRRLGAPASGQALGRALEHAAVAVAAAASGVVAGAVVGVIVTPALVRTAVGVDGPWPVPIRPDVGAWVVVAGAAALVQLLIIIAAARWTRHQAGQRRVTR